MIGVTLKLWNEKPANTSNFKIVTKISDLGSPMSFKSLLGFYINIRQEQRYTEQSKAHHDLNVYFRQQVSQQWTSLAIFAGKPNGYQPANMYFESILKSPIKGVRNVQIRIEGTVKGKFSLNDFGLLYRTYREISAQEHNED